MADLIWQHKTIITVKVISYSFAHSLFQCLLCCSHCQLKAVLVNFVLFYMMFFDCFFRMACREAFRWLPWPAWLLTTERSRRHYKNSWWVETGQHAVSLLCQRWVCLSAAEEQPEWTSLSGPWYAHQDMLFVELISQFTIHGSGLLCCLDSTTGMLLKEIFTNYEWSKICWQEP